MYAIPGSVYRNLTPTGITCVEWERDCVSRDTDYTKQPLQDVSAAADPSGAVHKPLRGTQTAGEQTSCLTAMAVTTVTKLNVVCGNTGQRQETIYALVQKWSLK